jgi:hypothetical protein
MKKRHALGLSLLIGLAAAAAALAAVKSVQVSDSQASPSVSQASIAVQQSALDRYEARLDAALAEARAQRAGIAETSAAGSPPSAVQSVQPGQRAEADDVYEHESDDHGGGRVEAEWEDD